jgi:ABC-2 type transport system permease protein
MNRKILLLFLKEFAVARVSFILVVIGFVAMLFPFMVIERSLVLPMLIFPFFFTNTGLQIDENNRGETLLCSLPLRRHLLVRARYLLALFFIIASFLLTLITAWLVKYIFPVAAFEPRTLFSLSHIYSWLFPLILMLSVYLPFYFRFGYVKGLFIGLTGWAIVITTVMGILYLAISLFTGSWSLLADFPGNVKPQIFDYLKAILARTINTMGLDTFLLLLTATAALLFLTSFLISLKLFKTRDL